MFLIMTSCHYFERTPEKILFEQFGFDLSDFNYNILYNKEEWSPNGDGYYIISIKFDEITQNNLKYLKSSNLSLLPIKRVLTPNDIPQEWESKKNGYYKLLFFDSNVRNFKILIIDLIKEELLIYYQIE